MRTRSPSNLRPLLRALYASLIAFATLWAMPRNAHAQLYVVQQGAGIVSEYHVITGDIIKARFIAVFNAGFIAIVAKAGIAYLVRDSELTISTYDATTGAVIDDSFIKLGFGFVGGLAVKDNTLFVALPGIDTVGAYDATTGAAINANFLTGVNEIGGLAVFRSVSEQKEFLFVTNRNEQSSGTVGKYDAETGFTINRHFITELHSPTGLAVTGNTLFVANTADGTVGKYDANNGAAINAGFITGLGEPVGLAVADNTLFVTSPNRGTVGAYDATTGAAINRHFITGLDFPIGIAVKSAK
jgi:hypothetical protein